MKKLCPVETFIKIAIPMLLIPLWFVDGPLKTWLEWAWTIFIVGIVVFVNIKWIKD